MNSEMVRRMNTEMEGMRQKNQIPKYSYGQTGSQVGGNGE